MPKTSKRYKNLYRVFRVLVIILLVGGFTYQTLEFLFLYWTYPTVVDIQQSSPFYLDVPAFTFCNRVGYNYESICKKLEPTACPNQMFMSFASDILCGKFPLACRNGTLPVDFQTIFFKKFMSRYSITQDDLKHFAMPLETYLNCTITFAGKTRRCNMDNVMGSFYSKEELPQLCYTIYSLWGNPNKKRERIPKGSVMKFDIFLNATRRPEYNESFWQGPLHNPPSDFTVQIGVHDPYFLPSPYIDGYPFRAGRAYEMRVKLNERHLLPFPYQTNCTDYMTEWRERGGKGAINQLGVIQECRINVTFAAIGCIPLSIDFPHKYNICRTCEDKEDCKLVEPANNCASLADSYNQPCDALTYDVEKEDKVITIVDSIISKWMIEDVRIRVTMDEHDCAGHKVFLRRVCSTIEIYVPFDRFDITNITYNPKYESLELFSVVGGYMGMWLGVSLLAFFDMFTEIVVKIKEYMAKRKRIKARSKKMKNTNIRVKRHPPTIYNVW